MALSLIVFLLLVLLFAIRGFYRGFFGALSGIFGLIGGYAAAIYGLNPVASFLKKHTALDGFLLYMLAGFLTFIVASFIITWIFNRLEQWIASTGSLSTSSRFGGLIVGMTVGGVIGLLVVYGLSIYHDVKQPTSTQRAFIDTTSRQVVSAATTAALSHAYPEAAAISTAITEEPVKISRSVNNILKEGELKLLLESPEYQQLLLDGDVDSITNNPGFIRLMQNPDMQYLLAESKLEQTGETQAQALAIKMSEIAQRMHNSKNDARVQAIINDPQFQQKLQSEDKLALMNDPQILRLAELVFNPDVTDNQSDPAVKPSEPDLNGATRIYRYIDKYGRIKFSDKPQE